MVGGPPKARDLTTKSVAVPAWLPTAEDESIRAMLPLISWTRQRMTDLHEAETRGGGRRPPHVELEVRLGTLLTRFHAGGGGGSGSGGGTHFVAGLPVTHYEVIARQLQKFDRWVGAVNLGETTVYYYTDERGRRLRTTGGGGGDYQVTHQQKQKRHEVTQVHHPRDHKRRGFDWRLGVSEETEIPAEEVPRLVNPDHVRIIQRNRYLMKFWQVDLSLVWSGASRAEAEQVQTVSGATQFEVELECHDLVGLLADKSDVRIALDVYLKVQSLLGLLDTLRLGFRPVERS